MSRRSSRPALASPPDCRRMRKFFLTRGSRSGAVRACVNGAFPRERPELRRPNFEPRGFKLVRQRDAAFGRQVRPAGLMIGEARVSTLDKNQRLYSYWVIVSLE